MGSRKNNGSERLRELDQEIERYREAAAAALGQLEWIIEYLHGIKKRDIARALERNRKQIVRELGDLR